MSTYKIYHWQEKTPYVPTNRQTKPGFKNSLYPWEQMKPGDSFFVPVKQSQNSKTIIRNLRQSAAIAGVFIHAYVGTYPGRVDTAQGIKVVHDGYYRDVG